MNAAVPAEAVLNDGGTIITATHRLARRIRRHHDQARAVAGTRAWPSADVLPLDAWLRRAWEAGTFRGAIAGAHRLLSDDESRLIWRRVLARDGHDRPDAGVIVPLVADGWRLCQAWQISAIDLHRAADSDDARAFAHWVDAYLALLGQHGWQDPGGLLAVIGHPAADALATGERRVGFAGFDPWTPALQRLAGAMREAGLVVVSVAPLPRTGTRGVISPQDENDEIARACAWAGARASASPDATVAIVIPTLGRDADRVRRVGLEVLSPGWQLREPRVRPLALAAGRQLADYPVVHCALNLLQLIGADVNFAQASQLLRSCYVAGAGAERAGRARAELKLRRRPVERIRLTNLVALLGTRAERAAGLWRQADLLAAPLRGRRLLPSQWAGQFTAWLTAAGWPGDRGLASEEYQAAEAWQGLLASFAGTDDVAGELALRAALGLLAQHARDRPFEPEGAEGAVQVLSLREAEGQNFNALWVCGMTAEQWPPPARAHALIPLSLQRAAGIPEATPAGIEALTRRRFERLVGSADEVVLSWPAEEAMTATLPSPLLKSLAAAVADDVSLHPDRLVIAASGVPGDAPADPPPALPREQAVRGGSRVLAMQAVCPARAFVEFRLRGAPLEAPARPLDPATRGKVVHQLLEQLYRDERCRAGLGRIVPDELREIFAPVVGAVFDEFLPAGDSFHDSLRPLESNRLWLLLLSLRDLDAQRPGFRVLTELGRRANIGPLALDIRLDRLDELADGGELVIDYKTGVFSPAGWKQPRLPESQLPLYAVTSGAPGANPCRGIAAIEIRVPDAKLRGVGDKDLNIEGVGLPEKFFRVELLAWDEVLARWREQLEQLAVEFAAGDFRVNPADRKWAVGQFAGLTRIYEFGPTDDADDGDTPDGPTNE
jgi:probable DNA repair protein